MAGLWAATVLSGCYTQPNTLPDTGKEFSQARADSTVSGLRLRLKQSLDHKGHPDSLSQAYHYLVRLGESAGTDQSYHALMSELCFLRATYTDLTPDSSQKLYEQGLRSARDLLDSSPRLLGYVLTDTVSIGSIHIDQIQPVTLDALYWWTLHSIFMIGKEPPIRRLAWRKRLGRAIRLIESKDPGYRWGGVKRLTALVLLVSPDGDLDAAQHAFRQAIALGQSYLENRYFYARYYGVLLQSKQMFQAQLQSILEQKTPGAAEYAQLNLLVKQKARTVLANTESYFSSISGADILTGKNGTGE